jgi:hypothetical protein
MKAARLQVEPERPCKGVTRDPKGPLSKGLEATDMVCVAAYGKRAAASLSCDQLPARRDRED